jgi:hypothetical protein
MVKLVKGDGKPLFSSPSKRLKFSICVIVANFIIGIIGMFLGADLTALGVFLSLSNAPLYVYILGESLRPTQVPDKYYEQQHSGAGGLGNIIGHGGSSSSWGSVSWGSTNIDDNDKGIDEYNIPTTKASSSTTKPKAIKPAKKDASEIG